MLITKQEKNVQTDHGEAIGGTEGGGVFGSYCRAPLQWSEGTAYDLHLHLAPRKQLSSFITLQVSGKQSKSMNLKIISQHACKFHRDVVQSSGSKTVPSQSKMRSI